MTLFKNKLDKGEIIDHKSNGSYERLSNFIWNRTHIKKSIMTIPYNSTHRSMKRYLADTLTILDRKDDNTTLYSTCENNSKIINDKYLSLLISSLQYIISNDFEKIKKLIKYLKNVATLLNLLELPITWTLPTGLTIKQSYL